MAKNDPTVKTVQSSDSGAHPARPNSEADDYAGSHVYKDNPDKPGPDAVAQIQVLPEDDS